MNTTVVIDEDEARRLSGPRPAVVSSPLTDETNVELCERIQTLAVRIAIASSNAGLDDHTAKPFGECELIARMRAVLRLSAPCIEKRICFGDVEVDIERRYIRRSGQTVKLTPNEYNLLLFFLNNVDLALTRDFILNEVWGYDCYPNTRTVDAHIVKLRRKLEPNPRVPRYLLTIHGVGYRFLMFPANAPPSEDASTLWRVPAEPNTC